MLDTVAPGGVTCLMPPLDSSVQIALGLNQSLWAGKDPPCPPGAAGESVRRQPRRAFFSPPIRGRNRAKPLQLGRKPLGDNKTPPGVLPGGTPTNTPKSQQRRQIAVTVFVPNRDRNCDSFSAPTRCRCRGRAGGRTTTGGDMRESSITSFAEHARMVADGTASVDGFLSVWEPLAAAPTEPGVERNPDGPRPRQLFVAQGWPYPDRIVSPTPISEALVPEVERVVAQAWMAGFSHEPDDPVPEARAAKYAAVNVPKALAALRETP